MLLRYQIAKENMPLFSSGKMDAYCAPIDKALEKGGKAGAAAFSSALEVLDKVGMVSRDRRKGQRYSEELLKAVKRVGKKATGASPKRRRAASGE